MKPTDPAFPGYRSNGLLAAPTGMDLRTYMATQIMAAMFSSVQIDQSVTNKQTIDTAELAVSAADALIKALHP